MAATEKLVEIDQENAHPTILNWYAKTIGLASPNLTKLCKDKKAFRIALSEKCGLPVSLVKELIIALLFGGSPENLIGEKINHETWALQKERSVERYRHTNP